MCIQSPNPLPLAPHPFHFNSLQSPLLHLIALHRLQNYSSGIHCTVEDCIASSKRVNRVRKAELHFPKKLRSLSSCSCMCIFVQVPKVDGCKECWISAIYSQCHLRKCVIAEPLDERSLSYSCVSNSNHGHLWGPCHPAPQPACHLLHNSVKSSPGFSHFSQFTFGPASINSVNRKGHHQHVRLPKCHQVHPESSPTRWHIIGESLARITRERNWRAFPPPPSLTAGAGWLYVAALPSAARTTPLLSLLHLHRVSSLPLVTSAHLRYPLAGPHLGEALQNQNGIINLNKLEVRWIF